MTEVFVDLQVRGLALGSRVRLSQMDASSGYLELPTPMPVGTTISLNADGTPISALVVEVQEQCAGVERPGMKIRPVLDAPGKVAWWSASSGETAALAPSASETPAPSAAEAPRTQPATEAPAEQPAGEPATAAPAAERSTAADSGSFVEAVGDADTSDAIDVDSPEPPVGTAEAAPRGRKRRRGNRR